jgi:hypothetical protein
MSGDPRTTGLSDEASDKAMRFGALAHNYAARNNLSFDEDKALRAIEDISTLYSQQMNQSYAATGNRIDDGFKSDINVCKTLESYADQ